MRVIVLIVMMAATASAETLTLKQVVARALQNAPEVQMALAQQEIAHQGYRVARSAFIPNLVVGSGAAATYGFPMSIEGASPSIVQVNSTAMVFNRPQRFNIEAARQSWRAAEYGSAARSDEVAWRAAAAYLELNKVRRSLEYARRDVESSTRVQQAVAVQLSEGRALPIDATRARLAVARHRQAVTALEGQASLLENMLRTLTGIPAAESIQTIDATLPGEQAPVDAAALETAIEKSLDEHPELKRLRTEAEAQVTRVRAEKAERWPQLDLVAQYAVLSKANNYERFFRDFQRNNAQLGVSVRFQVFDGKRIEARAGQAEAELMRARAAYEAARNDVSIELRRAFQEVQQRDSAMQVARLELEVARESLGVALARYDEGRVAVPELERVRAEESARWMAFYDASFALERARLDWLRQRGELAALLQQ